MWTVLVVEDEPFVRRAFIQHTDWAAQGFEIIGEAEDGAEALDRIRRLQPDVVISDIIMPIMNGLELLRQARDAGCVSRFVMLTCMNEFAYAQEAIQRGAFGYLLKSSMTQQELNHTLEKLRRELQREARNRRMIDDYVWNEWYARLWQQEMEQPAFPAGALPGNRVTVLSVLSDQAGSWAVVREQCGVSCSTETVVHEFRRHATTSWLLWGDDVTLLKPEQSLPMMACAIVNLRPQRLARGWRAVIHRLYEQWYDEGEGQANKLLRLGAVPEEAAQSKRLLPWAYEKQLIQGIDPFQPARFEEAYEQVWAYFRQHCFPQHQVKEIWERLLQQIAALCGGHATKEAAPVLPPLTGSTYIQWKEAISACILGYVQEYSKLQGALTDHPEVNRMLGKIHLHYNEPLSLADLAAYVNLEEHYISALFKRKTGMPFLKYVNHYRVEKAKVLLLQTSMPVSEIGQAVGFASDNHFTKMFKRWTGATPGAYRMTLRQEDRS